jgi:hypothetical protein
MLTRNHLHRCTYFTATNVVPNLLLTQAWRCRADNEIVEAWVSLVTIH